MKGDSSVSSVTKHRAGRPGNWTSAAGTISPSSEDWRCGLLCVPRSFIVDSDRGLKLIIRLHLTQTLINQPPLHHTCAWICA